MHYPRCIPDVANELVLTIVFAGKTDVAKDLLPTIAFAVFLTRVLPS
jgi:hypothetical protein